MRPRLRYLVAATAVVSLAACGEAPTNAVAKSRLSATSSPVFDFSGGGSRSFGDQSSEFKVTSKGGSFSVNGLFSVNFPENSVCDPDVSSYGPGEWENDCVTLKGKDYVRITARVRLTSTGVNVDFTPALRFSPRTQVTLSTDIFKSVLTSNRDYFASNHDALGFLAIGYSPSLGGSLEADYASDASIVTHVNLTTGSAWRRVKHFSGYMVVSGRACTPAPDNPDCVVVDGH